MTALLTAFGLALAVPLFFGSWRLALAGLGAQAWLMLGLELGGARSEHAWSAVLAVLDLGLLRGLAVPLLLARIAHRSARDALPLELLPGDLLYWVVAGLLVALGVELGVHLLPGDLAGAARISTATAELLLGLGLIAHHRTAFGQAIGMLTVENGAVLFEGVLGAAWPAPIHLGLTAVFGGLLLLVLAFLRDELDASHAPIETSPEVEVL